MGRLRRRLNCSITSSSSSFVCSPFHFSGSLAFFYCTLYSTWSSATLKHTHTHTHLQITVFLFSSLFINGLFACRRRAASVCFVFSPFCYGVCVCACMLRRKERKTRWTRGESTLCCDPTKKSLTFIEICAS